MCKNGQGQKCKRTQVEPTTTIWIVVWSGWGGEEWRGRGEGRGSVAVWRLLKGNELGPTELLFSLSVKVSAGMGQSSLSFLSLLHLE